MYTHPWDGTTNAQWDDVVLFHLYHKQLERKNQVMTNARCVKLYIEVTLSSPFFQLRSGVRLVG